MLDRYLVSGAMLLATVAGVQSASADPATASSLPPRIRGFGPVVMSGSTIYYTTPNDRAVPPGNRLEGLGLFSESEAVADPVALFGGSGSVRVVVADGAGGWYVGGAFPTAGGLPRQGVAHVLDTGAVDPAFVANIAGGANRVNALALVGGRLVIGGNFAAVNLVPRTNLAVVDAITGQVQTASPATNGEVHALAAAGGTFYVGGAFSMTDGLARAGIAAFDATTATIRPGFVANLNPIFDVASALAVVASQLYVGGSFATVNGIARANLARLDSTTGAVDPAWNPGTNGIVLALAADTAGIFAGGAFSTAGGQPRSRLALLDAATGAASPWRCDADAAVAGLHVGNGRLYAVGGFTTLAALARNSAGAVSTSTPAVVLGWDPSLAGNAIAIAVQGGRVAVGGGLGGWGAALPRAITAVDSRTGEVLPWAPRFGGSIYALIAAGTRLVAAGQFSSVDGAARANLAAFDLDTHALLPLSIAIDGPIWAMAVVGDVLYIGGMFSVVNGTFRINLAAIDLATGALMPWEPQADALVFTMTAVDDRIVVGGAFMSLIGTNGFRTRQRLGEITTSGLITTFDAGAIDGDVSTLTVGGGTVYFGGMFASVQATSRAFVAAVDRQTGTLLPWNPVLAGTPPWGLHVHRGTVYLAGEFSTVSGQPRPGIASVDALSGALTSWVPAVSAPLAPTTGIAVNDFGVAVVRGWLSSDRAEQSLFFPEQQLAGPPGAPVWPAVRVVGNVLGITWAAPVIGPRPSGFLLEAGTGPGRSDIGVLPLIAATFSVGGVPPGTYYVRLRAVNAVGAGAASRELVFTVGSLGCTMAPAAPLAPVVTVAGATVIVSWTASPGSAPSSFAMHAGTADGVTNIGTFPMGAGTSFTTGGVPPGVYFVRVTASNGCGPSAVSPDGVLRVGGAAGPPGTPLQFIGTTGSGIVSLSWMSSTSGGAPAGHQLEAGRGPGLSDIATVLLGPGTGFAVGGVPPGTYYLRIRAINGAGPSRASGEAVIVVP